MAGAEDSPENYHHVTYDRPTQADADTMVANSWKAVLDDIKRVVEAGQHT